MAYRTMKQAAEHFSAALTEMSGRPVVVTERQVRRWLEQGRFKDTKKIEAPDSKAGFWFVGDDLPPMGESAPIPRKAPKGPRVRSQRPNAWLE